MKIITLITTFFTLLSSVKADPSVLFDATFIEEMSQFDLLKGRVVLYAEAKQTQLLEGNINLQIDEYVTTLEKLINDELDITSTDYTQDENRSYLRSDVHQVQDTDTPESAMSDATEAMEIGMGELARLNKEIKTLTTGLESSVRDMGSSISEFSSEDIVSYSLLIDKAVITVFVADNEAQGIMKRMIDRCVLTLSQLENGSAIQFKMAQLLIADELQSNIKSMEKLRDDVLSAENDFREISNQSEGFAVSIKNSIQNQEGYFKSQSEKLSTEIYGYTCGPICVLTGGLGCVPCYAIAVPIIETRIAGMKKDMEATQRDLGLIGNGFTSTAEIADELGDLALDQAEIYEIIGGRLELTYNMAITSDSIPFWENEMPARINELEVFLRDQLEQMSETETRRLTESVAEFKKLAADALLSHQL